MNGIEMLLQLLENSEIGLDGEQVRRRNQTRKDHNLRTLCTRNAFIVFDLNARCDDSASCYAFAVWAWCRHRLCCYQANAMLLRRSGMT